MRNLVTFLRAHWVALAVAGGVGLVLGWYLGNGPGREFAGYWNRNPGFATLVAGIIAGVVTLAYVVLTYRLVGEGKASIDAAKAANKEALTANTLTREALEHERLLYDVTLRSRLDSLMPVVLLKVNSVELLSTGGKPVSLVPHAEFRLHRYRLRVELEAWNHGPGPARLWLREPWPGPVYRHTKSQGTRPLVESLPIAEHTGPLLILELDVGGDEVIDEWSSLFQADEQLASTLIATSSPVPIGTEDVHHFWVKGRMVPQVQDVGSKTFEWVSSGVELLFNREYPPT